MRDFIGKGASLQLFRTRPATASSFSTIAGSRNSGAVMMDDKTRKEVIIAYQTRKKDEFLHPYLGEKVAVGLLPHVQALLLARFLRGDLDGYPPLIWK